MEGTGKDGLPTGYLKMCGKPLMTVLARLYNTTLHLGHWPSPFRRARVVVLPKPGKTQEQLRFTDGWRPIALPSCLGKPLEKITYGSPESDPGLDITTGQLGAGRGGAPSCPAPFGRPDVSLQTLWGHLGHTQNAGTGT